MVWTAGTETVGGAAVVDATLRLHRQLADVLPAPDLSLVLEGIFTLFNRHLREAALTRDPRLKTVPIGACWKE